MQTGSSVTLIGWKSGKTTYVPLWVRMEGAWLRTLLSQFTVLEGTKYQGITCFPAQGGTPSRLPECKEIYMWARMILCSYVVKG
jgi:hypothetical protein